MILTHCLYPFHGAVPVLQSGSCFVRISTAKEGIFKGNSTMFSMLPHAHTDNGEGAASAR